jgi:hypothetical protein
MADLTFSQSERRSFLVPALLAVAALAIGIAILAWFTPYRHPELTVTHMAVLPTHTVFSSDTKLVVARQQAQDDLYVVATVNINDRVKFPITINDITATLTAPDDSILTTTAVEKADIPNLYITFPKLVPLSSAPLLRETTIQPGAQTEGMVILHFPVAESDWNSRKSAAVTISFYNQGSFTAQLPK